MQKVSHFAESHEKSKTKFVDEVHLADDQISQYLCVFFIPVTMLEGSDQCLACQVSVTTNYLT